MLQCFYGMLPCCFFIVYKKKGRVGKLQEPFFTTSISVVNQVILGSHYWGVLCRQPRQSINMGSLQSLLDSNYIHSFALHQIEHGCHIKTRKMVNIN